MKRVFKFILELIIIIFVFLAVVEIAFVLMKDENGVTHFGNYIPIPIRDDSMEPTINMDDLIVDKEVSTPTKIKENDVITYLAINGDTKEIRTGRVISVINLNGSISWKVRGDNQGESSVTTVSSNDLIGEFTNTKMLFAGGVLAFTESQNGFLVCIIIPLLLIFFLQICKLIHTVITSKKIKKEEKKVDDDIEKTKVEAPTIEEKNKLPKEVVSQTNSSIPEDNKDELAAPIVVSEPIPKKEENSMEVKEIPEINMPDWEINNQNQKIETPKTEAPIINEISEPNFSKPKVESIPITAEKIDNTNQNSKTITEPTNDASPITNEQKLDDDIEIL